MIIGNPKTKYDIPKFIIGDKFLTYRYMGFLTYRYMGLHGSNKGDTCDVYIAVSATEDDLKSSKDAVMYNGKYPRSFCPYLHTGDLCFYTEAEIRAICNAYKIAIVKGYFNPTETTNKLFGLEGKYDMSFIKYLDYIAELRDKLAKHERKLRGPVYKNPYKVFPTPIILTNRPAFLLRSV